MSLSLRMSICSAALLVSTAAPLIAQVHHHPDGQPWKQRANEGPDAEAPGWFYNLGVTGLRIKLDDDAPTHLIVGHVLGDSCAAGKIEVDAHLLGAGGKRFEVPHQNGYGMEVFGPRGPIQDFADAYEAALRSDKHKLELLVQKDGKEQTITLSLPRRTLAFADTFPFDCKKTERVRERLLDHLVEAQREDGSFGNPVHNTFAPLALLSSRKAAHRAAVERSARRHAATTSTEDKDWLVNWKYMAAAIVLSEYELAEHKAWIGPQLEEIYTFLSGSQYMDLSQVNPKAKETHPGSYPKNNKAAHGGWGHNPGFEGYGPIAMLTGQGALALSLMERAGVEVDPARTEAAFEFLDRGTGKNGYLWYADSVASDNKWADMGRTGAAGIAYAVSTDPEHRSDSKRYATVIGEHPESFPDTHGSPLMGMGYAALAAGTHPKSFQRLMSANRWWFALSECPDGTFYYQPNRDNAGYGADARLAATAVVALILSIPEGRLVITGRKD